MSQVNLNMSLPLDEDGFLRRECPHCERQFKWRPTQTEGKAPVTSEELPTYFCPMCGRSAPAGAWWTQAQVKHAEAIAKKEVLEPMLNDFQTGLRRLNRPGSSIRIETKPVRYKTPLALPPDPNDMRVVLPACHPDEPIKVPEDWTLAVHCLICGQTINLEEKAKDT